MSKWWEPLSLLVVFFLSPYCAAAEDGEIQALRAKLAEQQAIINKLEPKIQPSRYKPLVQNTNCVKTVTSINKNSSVNIGGFVKYRYEYYSGKIDSIYANPDDPRQQAGLFQRRAEVNQSDFRIFQARLTLKIDVNKHFDGLVHIDLQTSNDDRSDNCHRYWVRWKDICNSGFGLKVGRDDIVFGGNYAVGQLSDAAKWGDGALRSARWGNYGRSFPDNRLGMGQSGLVPVHNLHDNTRVDQVTPYWQGMDGRLKAEVSFIQNLANNSGRISNARAQQTQFYLDGNTYKSRNYGFGSMSARVKYQPIEGLELAASALNFYDGIKYADFRTDNSHAKNNTAVDMAVSYRPAFFNRLKVWLEYNHGWNVYGRKDVDSDVFSYGAALELAKGLNFFAQGDYVRTTDKLQQVDSAFANDDQSLYWTSYVGLQYKLPYGVILEAGWKHESVKWNQNISLDANGIARSRVGGRMTTVKAAADTIYGHVGFHF